MAIVKIENSLAFVCPDLAKEWHPTKNGDLKPTDVTPGSNKKVWWLLSYDDPKTGKHFNFKWQALVKDRFRWRGCPYLSGQSIWPGFNDLATTNPELAKEWHPTKNGNLKPTDVMAGSNKKVWWLLSYDDPKTGKHFDFEWQATVHHRSCGSGCPYLSGRDIWIGFNDLATTNPDLTKEWHPTKNGDLKPTDVMAGSGKKVWWLLSYDDPKTGCHYDFEWQAQINARSHGVGCPYLSGQSVWPGFNDLGTINPELAKEWHPTKNGNLKPVDVTATTKKKVWWLLSYDDPRTSKHFDFVWKTSINSRSSGNKCPYLSGQSVWPGFNDLATTNPDLAKEWHPTKNGNLKPTDVTVNSKQKVWWLLSYDDPSTGKHFDFEWKSTVTGRASGNGCPYLSGHDIWPGFNDLATTNPELAKEWHPTKNGNLKPTDVTANSKQKVWWLLQYDDPKTGKHFIFEWESIVYNRSNGYGCPYLSGHDIWPGFNDLATVNPELAKEWHPTKNGNLKPTDILAGSNKKVWWQISVYDLRVKKHVNYEWESSVNGRSRGRGCPFIKYSIGERFIGKWLMDNKIDFKYEKRFNDLKGRGNGNLSYDFFITNSSILIEYQGKQHYQAVEHFGGEKRLEIQKKHDALKRQYAKNHGYPLIEIPYTVDTQEKINDFMEQHVRPLLKNKSQVSA